MDYHGQGINMANINWQDIGELTAVNVSSINKAIVIPAKEALRQAKFAIGGNLTVNDNMYAAIITLGNSSQTLQNGVEYTFKNPLKTTPIGFTPIKSVDANNSSIAIPQCELNISRTDGLIGITPFIFSTTGYVGEFFESFINRSATTALVNGTAKTITSINLSPGVWNVYGVSVFSGALTGTVIQAGISLTTNTMPGVNEIGRSRMDDPQMPTAQADKTLSVINNNFSITIATTIFLVSLVNFTVGTAGGHGRISAVRTSMLNNGQTGIVTGILWGG